MDGVLSFAAAFGTVLLLGLQSKIMRDDRWFAAFFTSWAITVTQTATTYIIAHRPLPVFEYLMWAGFGGSIGIVCSHFLYDKIFGKRNDSKPDSKPVVVCTDPSLHPSRDGNWERRSRPDRSERVPSART